MKQSPAKFVSDKTCCRDFPLEGEEGVCEDIDSPPPTPAANNSAKFLRHTGFFAIDRSSFYIRICQQKQPVFIIFTQPNIQIELIASFQFAKPVKTPRKMVTSEFKCISVIILTCQGVPAPQDVQTLSFYVFAVICTTSNAHSCWCEIFKLTTWHI